MIRRPPAMAVFAAGIVLAGCAGGALPVEQAQRLDAQSQGVQPPALLPAAAAYVEAVARRDLDALEAAFAPTGVVVDVRRRIEGRAAIREWAAREVIGGSLRVDAVTTLGPRSQRLRVHWAPLGSGGWAADYTFAVTADGIVEADLQYAR